MVRLRVVNFGGLNEKVFESTDLFVQSFNDLQVSVNVQQIEGIDEPISDSRTVGLVPDVGWLGEIVLQMDDLDMCECFGSASDKVSPSPHKISGSSALLGIDVRELEIATADDLGNFFRVDRVRFDFSVMNCLEVEGVPQDECELAFFALVGEPVPIEG